MTTVHQAVQQGDRVASLRALRDVLAASIDGSDSGRDVAALAARLMDVLAQIDVAEKASAPVKGTPLDELRNRRDARGSEPRRGARPAG